MVRLDNSNSDKVVLTLLAEIVTFYMEPTTINVRELVLNFVSKRFSFQSLSLKDQLNDLLEIFFGITDHVNVSSHKRSSKKFI